MEAREIRRTNEAVAVAANSNGLSSSASEGTLLTVLGNSCRGEIKGNMCQVCGSHRSFRRREIHTEVVYQCHNHLLLSAHDDDHEASPPPPAPAPPVTVAN